jgi:O-antigen/teichoic acid export membrane protein
MLAISLFAGGNNNRINLINSVTRSLKMTILLVCPAVALCFPLGKWVLSLFGHGYSVNATHLLWLLAIAALPASLNQVYFSVQRVRERMRYMVAINIFIALMTLILSYFLLPKMGIIGAGISYLFAQTIPAAVVSVWLINSKLMRDSIEEPVANQ